MFLAHFLIERRTQMGLTTQFKLKWLEKRKDRLKHKVELAFMQTRKELVDFLNSYNGKIDTLIKYLASCVDTDDVFTFIHFMEEAIDIAKQYKNDPDAKKAISICSSIILRIHLLSNFTIPWTNVKVKCKKCKKILDINFLYTDKICPICGSIIL